MVRHHAVQLAKDDAVLYMVECSLSVEATCERGRSSAVVVLAYVMCDCDVLGSRQNRLATGVSRAYDGLPILLSSRTSHIIFLRSST